MRVDLINVVMQGGIDFEGPRTLTFSFKPGPEDAALVAALEAKNDALLLAAARAEGKGDPNGTLG